MKHPKDHAVDQLVKAWVKRGTDMGALDQLEAIKNALYAFRNGQVNAKDLAPDLVSADAEVMAAVEHYFYARSQVCSGEYSLTSMKVMIVSYQLAKGLGFDLRHNESNPTTPPSDLQKNWALLGADQGERDRLRENSRRKVVKQPLIEAPVFRMPPNFIGAFKNVRLDKFKY